MLLLVNHFYNTYTCAITLALALTLLITKTYNKRMNDDIMEVIATFHQDRKFALRAYCKFLKMFGTIILGFPVESYNSAALKVTQMSQKESKVFLNHDLDQLSPESLVEVISLYKRICDVPSDPW